MCFCKYECESDVELYCIYKCICTDIYIHCFEFRETLTVFTESLSFCGTVSCFRHSEKHTQPHPYKVRTSGSRNEGSSFDSKLQATKNHTCAGGSIWISSLVNALLEINQREDIKSNSGALCLLLRLLIDNNILRTLAAIPSHLLRSDKVAGCLCA